MSIKLKIKSKHLALEPAIIRIEERKLIKQIKHYKQYHQLTTDRCSYDEHPEFYELYGKFHSLNSHRRFDVRNEARATYLARAYIEGRKYNTIENEIKDLGTFNVYILPRVVSMVIKYMHGRNEKFMKPEAIKVVRDEVKAWCNE
jgi:hypothetical protein